MPEKQLSSIFYMSWSGCMGGSTWHKS